MTEPETMPPRCREGAAAEPEDGPDGPGPSPYERAQQRLRVDGVVFGAAVKRFREAEGWSVRSLSKRSGVPLTTVAKLERGETDAPDVEVMTALALTFGYGSPGAMLGAAGTARRPGHRAAWEEREVAAWREPVAVDRLVEELLRGVWAAQDARAPAGAPGASGGLTPEGVAAAVGAAGTAGAAVRAEGGVTIALNFIVFAGAGPAPGL